MKPLFLLHSIGFIYLCHVNAVLAENVCENKPWLQSPIVEKATADNTGIGGTGLTQPSINQNLIFPQHSSDESGIGGTGVNQPTHVEGLARADDGESGIGGTGIVGVISGFGSICVNGVEIHFNDTTTITQDGVPTQSNQLALGQTVSVLARTESANYYATEIRVINEVKGEVQTIDKANSVFYVLGQRVHLPALQLEKMTLAEPVTISGNRLNDGSIEATRVEKSDKQIETVSLIGPLKKDTASGGFYIGKQLINAPDNFSSLQMGDEVRVQGVLKDNVLHVNTLEQNPRWAFSSKVDQLLVQGHVREGNEVQFNIDGLHVKIDNTDTKAPKVGQYVGVWVHPHQGVMTLHHWQTEALPLEYNHSGHREEHVKTTPLSSQNEKIEREANAVEKKLDTSHGTIERPEVSHHEIEKHDINKPDIVRPEIEKYEIVRPDMDRPEMNRVDIDKPTLLHLDVNRPEIQRIEKIEKPVLLHLEINRPDIPLPRR